MMALSTWLFTEGYDYELIVLVYALDNQADLLVKEEAIWLFV
jgi:hypothetical protein